MAKYRFQVGREHDGLRLDKFLSEQFPQKSRSALQRHIQEGAVAVDGLPARPSRVLREGQVVTYEPPQPRPLDVVAQHMPLKVLFEDEHILVLDKPAGLVVHPAAGHPDGTLVNALVAHCPDLKGIGDVLRPGIVHRLDKDTSGVMVVAKTEPAHHGLQAAFSAHHVVRIYLALVRGHLPDQGSWDTPYGRHPVRRKLFTSRQGSKRAVTHFAVLDRFPGGCLVAARLSTGRTHQVRVQFAEAGHPLLGDRTYGRTPKDKLLRQVAEGLGRQALHAAVLGFRHPVQGVPIFFVSEPPRDFLEALAALGLSFPPPNWPPPDLRKQVETLPQPGAKGETG